MLRRIIYSYLFCIYLSLPHACTNQNYLYLQKGYALFYQGRTSEEGGRIAEAFSSYKEAQEVAAALKDDYLLGLASANMAELYQNQYHFETAIELFREALGAYRRAGKGKHICYTLIMMGKLFLPINADSSAYYCREAGALARQMQDFEYEFSALMNMYNVLRKQKAFAQARDLLFENVERFAKKVEKENDILLQISLLHYEMGQLDSARHYVSLVVLDSLEAPKQPGTLLLMKLIEEKMGNFKEALEYYAQYKYISDKILQKNQADDLKEAASRYYHEKLRSENYALKNKILSMVIVLLTLIMVTLLIIRKLKQRAKKREERLKKMSILREDELMTRSMMREEQLKQIVERRFSVVKSLLNLSYIKDPQSNNFVERFRAIMTLSANPQETFFADLIPLMNDFYFGVIDRLRECYGDLSDADVELICLLFFKFSPQELCVLYGLENIGAIYTRRSRVAKKLKLDKNVSIGRFLQKKIEELRSQKVV